MIILKKVISNCNKYEGKENQKRKKSSVNGKGI